MRLQRIRVLFVVAVVGSPALSVRLDAQCEFVRGNVTNETGLDVVDLNDAVDLLAYLFLGTLGSIPDCPDAADANDNGYVEMSDYLYLVDFLLASGDEPSAPFPDRGVDPTPGTTISETRDARFSYSIGSGVGFPSNTGLEVPLTLSNEVPVEGFQLVFEYDGSAIRIDEIRLEGTALSDFSEGSYIIAQSFNRDGVSYAGVSALLDWDPPLSHVTIDAGEDNLIATLVVAVQATAQVPQTTQMKFVDGVIFPSVAEIPDDQLSEVHNFIIVGNEVVRPDLDSDGGVIDIKTAFIRADANNDKRLDIADPVFMLQYLFFGNAPPPCEDAGDGNNDGKLDLADPVFILGYLFRGTAQPPAPFPAPGLDPEINNPEVDPLVCDL